MRALKLFLKSRRRDASPARVYKCATLLRRREKYLKGQREDVYICPALSYIIRVALYFPLFFFFLIETSGDDGEGV